MRKLMAPILVIAVVLISLRAVDSLRDERSGRRDAVVATITANAGGDIDVMTPLLVLDVEERFPEVQRRTREVVKQGVVVREEYETTEERVATVRHAVVAKDAHLDLESAVETRHIGIFPGRIQQARVSMTGAFLVSPSLVMPHRHGGVTRISSAAVWWHFQSLSTLAQVNAAKVSGTAISFQPASGGLQHFQLLSAHVPGEAVVTGVKAPFELNFVVRGGSTVQLRPLAEQSTTTLRANWPHADFSLQRRRGYLSSVALPNEHQSAKDGVSAQWLMSGLSMGLKSSFQFDSQSERELLESAAQRVIGVDFIEPVDVFARVERSIKYGGLLIAIVLGLLWALTLRVQHQTHFMHFTLMAMSLAVFFLLLLSLAEKVDFVWAYVASAAAVVGLNTAYLGGVLKSAWRSMVANAPSAVSFAALYGLLVSEDHALLLGSALVFGLLASVMMLTRHLDWRVMMGSRSLHGPVV